VDGPEIRGVLLSDLFQTDKPQPGVIVVGKQPLGALSRRIQLRLGWAAVGVGVVLRQCRRHKECSG